VRTKQLFETGKGTKMAEDVTVTEAIKQLRAQIEEAQREGVSKGLHFVAKSIEIELGIVFKSEVEGKAGVKAWFLDVSGRTTGADETTHKVKLVLQPIGRGGEPVVMSDKD
jgi:hypothetical protein